MFNKVGVLFGSSVFSAIGLLGLAIYQGSTKDYGAAFQSVMAALALLGITKQVNTNQKVLMANQKMMFSAMKLSNPDCDKNDNNCCK